MTSRPLYRTPSDHPGLGWHLRWRSTGDAPLAPSPAARRVLAATTLEVGRHHGLFVFRAVDTHVHVELATDDAGAAVFARRFAQACHARLGVTLEAERPKAFRDQWHRANTFAYVLGNDVHHGVATDPFHDASLLPDLLGLRVTPHFSVGTVRELLPRLRRADLVAFFGREPPNTPGTSLDPLAESAAAAAGVGEMGSRAPEAVAARVAAVHAASAASDAALAEALHIDRATVWRLRQREPWKALVRAAGLQMALRAVPAPLERPAPVSSPAP